FSFHSPEFTLVLPILLHEFNQAGHARPESLLKSSLFGQLPLIPDAVAELFAQGSGSGKERLLSGERPDSGHWRADPSYGKCAESVHEALHVGEHLCVLAPSGGLDHGGIFPLQRHAVDQAVAAIEQRFHLRGDAEDVVRAGENETVTGQKLVLDRFVVVIDFADAGFVAEVAGDAWQHFEVFQGEDFRLRAGSSHSRKDLLQKASGVSLHAARAGDYGKNLHHVAPFTVPESAPATIQPEVSFHFLE